MVNCIVVGLFPNVAHGESQCPPTHILSVVERKKKKLRQLRALFMTFRIRIMRGTTRKKFPRDAGFLMFVEEDRTLGISSKMVER